MISLPNQTGNATMMRWIEQKMYFRWQLMRMFNQRKIALTQICLSVSINEMKKDYNKNVRVITIIIPAFSLSLLVCAVTHNIHIFINAYAYIYMRWTMRCDSMRCNAIQYLCIKRINIIITIFIGVYLCNDRSLNFWSKLTLFCCYLPICWISECFLLDLHRYNQRKLTETVYRWMMRSNMFIKLIANFLLFENCNSSRYIRLRKYIFVEWKCCTIILYINELGNKLVLKYYKLIHSYRFWIQMH